MSVIFSVTEDMLLHGRLSRARLCLPRLIGVPYRLTQHTTNIFRMGSTFTTGTLQI